MRRLFGKKKEAAPGPSLGDVSRNLESRAGSLDTKIKALDVQLAECKAQLQTKRGAAAQQVKQRALRLLRQKKMYEKQRDGALNQQVRVAGLFSFVLFFWRGDRLSGR
jgi:charged multivesicular body protein 5